MNRKFRCEKQHFFLLEFFTGVSGKFGSMLSQPDRENTVLITYMRNVPLWHPGQEESILERGARNKYV